jgi:hypothetical protein
VDPFQHISVLNRSPDSPQEKYEQAHSLQTYFYFGRELLLTLPLAQSTSQIQQPRVSPRVKLIKKQTPRLRKPTTKQKRP